MRRRRTVAKSPTRTNTKRKPLDRHDLADLPDDVRNEMLPHVLSVANDSDMLEEIADALRGKRDEAKTARESYGIEEVWRNAEEAYFGIDEANRLEYQSARWAKPMSSEGPVTTGRQPPAGNQTKSTLYVGLTQRYVDAGYAKISEIILQADEKNFSLKGAPLAHLIEAKADKRILSATDDDGKPTGQPLMRPTAPGEAPPPAPPPSPLAAQGPAPASSPGASLPAAGAPGGGGSVPPPGVAAPSAPTPPGAAPAANAPPAGQTPVTVSDLAEENLALADKAAKRAETRIYNWMVIGKYRRENRKILFDAARLGVGILKGPVPKIKSSMALTKGDNNDKESDPEDYKKPKKIKVKYEDKIIPTCVWVNPWKIYPDPTCGEVIAEGAYCFELDHLTDKGVRDLAKEPGYIGWKIEEVLEEGPDGPEAKARENGGEGDITGKEDQTKGRYDTWYYYGTLKRKDFACICMMADPEWTEESAGMSPPSNDDRDVVDAIVTMINDHVVKAALAPLDSGKIPYKNFSWKRRPGHWAGIGIAEQMMPAQKMLNGAVRSMMNNAGKSAGSQIVIDQKAVRPADGQWNLTPDKVWYKSGEEVQGPIDDVFKMYEIPNVTEQLMKIVQLAMQIAEDTTSITLSSTGGAQKQASQPGTFGGAQIQDSNQNQLLRSIGYSYDDCITEPVVEDMYEYLLMDDEVPDNEKGDFEIDAHGSIVLVEKAIQDQTIAQMGQLVTNPEFEIDPAKWATQMIKMKKLDPTDFKYTPQQLAAKQAQPPPEDPKVTVAKVTAASQEARTKAVEQSETERAHIASSDSMAALKVKRELAMLEYANNHKMTILDVQSQLAETSMKLQAEMKLNDQNNHHEIHKAIIDQAPPAEVPGRAADGHEFDQSAGRPN